MQQISQWPCSILFLLILFPYFVSQGTDRPETRVGMMKTKRELMMLHFKRNAFEFHHVNPPVKARVPSGVCLITPCGILIGLMIFLSLFSFSFFASVNSCIKKKQVELTDKTDPWSK